MTWRPRSIANVAASVAVAAALVYLCAAGAGPLPPLGATFNPGNGVWSAAADAALPTASTLHLAGLRAPVQVIFERNGTPHVTAVDDHDLYWTIGYLHARFRLFQMDLSRRQGEGSLAEIVGPAALSSDEFELRLGLLRTARAEWAAMTPTSATGRVLTAYADGVNARLAEDLRNGNLPLLFKMLGYQPRPWTPVDTLVIQGDMIQSLDFTDTPLDEALLVKAMGYQRVARWFPVLPPDAQQPYDRGPYPAASAAALSSQQSALPAAYAAIADLKQQIGALPPTSLHSGGNSNNWAVSGAKTASGRALLAGDPHLHQTLPAVWYQLDAAAPDVQFSGVTFPGVPLVLIGHNRHIAWSETNVQNQVTLFYLETTDRAHPDQYYWRGAWRRMRTIPYDIAVKGGGSVHLDVKLTVHGPILSDDRLPGKTISIFWVGTLPSYDIAAVLGVTHASNFQAFRAALRGWHAPSQNFVYADDRGNIGLISAGTYPLVRRGDPWLPLPGTGEYDVAGAIPFDQIPQLYNPADHVVFSANQRPVGNDYPYYIGTTLNFFDNGYRADEIHQALEHGTRLTAADMERLQNSTHDYLAGLIVPRLLDALSRARLSPREAHARDLLRSWNGMMDANAPAAAIWWTFWSRYLVHTFQPWWSAYKVPDGRFNSLSIGPWQTSLVEDLEAWTLRDPANPAFTPPHSPSRSAAEVMAASFKDAVAKLAAALDGNPADWRWGRIHAREFDSLAQIPSLSYGPRAAGGDSWTVDAADGGDIATAGPSWRFVMDWSTGGEGVYPGGQSENPLSPWYENQIEAWWNGRYYPLLDAAAARRQGGSVTWTIQP